MPGRGTHRRTPHSAEGGSPMRPSRPASCKARPGRAQEPAAALAPSRGRAERPLQTTAHGCWPKRATVANRRHGIHGRNRLMGITGPSRPGQASVPRAIQTGPPGAHEGSRAGGPESPGTWAVFPASGLGRTNPGHLAIRVTAPETPARQPGLRPSAVQHRSSGGGWYLPLARRPFKTWVSS